MSQFYARYVPPAVTNGTTPSQSPDLKRSSHLKSPQPAKKRKLQDAGHEPDVIAKYSSSKSAQKYSESVEVIVRRKTQPKSSNGEVDGASQEKKKRRRSEKSARKEESDMELQAVEEDQTQVKHSAVFSRLNKSRRIAQSRLNQEEAAKESNTEEVENNVHPDRAIKMDLGPIPQPQDPEPVTKPALYSTAPEWVQNPIRVSEEARVAFKGLGICKKLLENLGTQGKKTALPVQCSVLPLVLGMKVERRSDICVAAATGSGKTLTYVLPILQSLRKRSKVTLTAVVVVPTRALVKQVLQTFETYSEGLDIQLGSVEGSKSLEEERKQLIEERMIYAPDEYRRQREEPVDWSNFSLEDLLEQAQETDFLANVGYISEYHSKVDILVATPGRLIEHLQSTKGFNLDHVEWFVADEADRLLNESYHDWLDVVLPALKSQKATERRDTLLRQMRVDVPKRIVTKMLLSATMTNDISQLMSLELRKPQLVLIESTGSKEDHTLADLDTSRSNTEFTLPSRLQESAVALKDSENKPLYLVELLNQHIFKGSQSAPNLVLRPAVQSHHVTTNGVQDDTSSSSSSSSSSDSSSTRDSETSSDSDNDSTTSEDTSDSSSVSSESSSTVRNSSPEMKLPKKSFSESTPYISKSTIPRALVFTKSTESAHRLARLLSLLSPSLRPVISTLTRSSSNTIASSNAEKLPKPTKAQQRTFRKTLSSFISGDIRILISTDLSSRGLDIPNLEHVINYDVPASALTYVHRVGRTARAGQAGSAWTLVEHKQGKWFWETIAGKGKVEDGTRRNIGRSGKVGRVEVKIADEWKEKYDAALKQLGEDVAGR